jgi:hypothetical protein
MADASNLQLTIDFSNSDLDSEELEDLTKLLFEQMDSLEEVKKVERIREKPTGEVKAGAEDLGKWLVGILTTEIPIPNLMPVVKFVLSRLSGKRVKLKASAKGKTLELEAIGTSQEEVLAIIQKIKDFAEGA